MAAPALDRKLGLADVTLIVMGGIIGSGIFVNPSVVAARAGNGRRRARRLGAGRRHRARGCVRLRGAGRAPP
jgi:amino acid transporter